MHYVLCVYIILVPNTVEFLLSLKQHGVVVIMLHIQWGCI